MAGMQDVPASCLRSPGSEPSSHTNRRAFKGSQQTRALGCHQGQEGSEGTWERYRKMTSSRTEGANVFSPALISPQICTLWSALGFQGLPHADLPSPELSLPTEDPGWNPRGSSPSKLMGPKHLFNRHSPFWAIYLHFIGSIPSTQSP